MRFFCSELAALGPNIKHQGSFCAPPAKIVVSVRTVRQPADLITMGSMPGFAGVQRSMNQLSKIGAIAKEHAGNHTRLLEEVSKLQDTLKVEATENQSSMFTMKMTLGVVGLVATFALCMLGYLLRDEYRQNQLRKKGYGPVPS